MYYKTKFKSSCLGHTPSKKEDHTIVYYPNNCTCIDLETYRYNKIGGIEIKSKKEYYIEMLYQGDDKRRFVLGEVTGNNPLICFGINPSKAKIADSKLQTDRTIAKIRHIVDIEKYDGWIMLNLYAQVTSDPNNLDKVLNIFLRVNSMGTKLNYSDLLLSIATAQWQERDAREEINKLVDELNKIGDGFDIDKDFVLRASLYLIKEIKNIRFKVDNFKKENMDLIEENWDNIANSLDITLKLLKSFGYNKDNLSAYTPVLPVALYILENNIDYKIINHSSFNEDRELIKEWIIKSTLKRIFTGSENIAKIVRDVVLENGENLFPLKKIKEKLKMIPGRSINFSEEEVESLLDYGYYNEGTFSILQLLYPNLDYRNKFHIDHIYPKSKFNQKYLKKQNVDFSQLYDSNYLANLQLLEGNQNIEKSNKEFKDWLEENFSKEEKKEYFKKNYRK